MAKKTATTEELEANLQALKASQQLAEESAAGWSTEIDELNEKLSAAERSIRGLGYQIAEVMGLSVVQVSKANTDSGLVVVGAADVDAGAGQ